jgi:hypothetical protein
MKMGIEVGEMKGKERSEEGKCGEAIKQKNEKIRKGRSPGGKRSGPWIRGFVNSFRLRFSVCLSVCLTTLRAST